MQKKYLTIILFFLVAASLSMGFLIPIIFQNENQQQISGPMLPFQLPTTTVATPTPNPEPTHTPGKPLVIRTNCTYHIYYWQAHPETWPARVTLGGVTYNHSDGEVILTAQTEDTSILVLQQMYVAYLNVLNGAYPGSIQSTINDADRWLSEYPPGTTLSSLNQEIGITYIETLSDFNNGLAGPGSCNDQPPTPTPVLTATPTVPAAAGDLPATDSPTPANLPEDIDIPGS